MSSISDSMDNSKTSSPIKHLRHTNYDNIPALLGWISFHLNSSTLISNLNQLDDGTVLLRLIDVVTGFNESDKLQPLYISTNGVLSTEIFSIPNIELNNSLPTPPISPNSIKNENPQCVLSTPSSSPIKKNLKKIKIINKDLSRFQKLANIEIFMQWLNTSKLSPFNGISKVNNISDINIRGVSALDILESNEKLVPGLLWNLFWDFTMISSNNNNNKNKQDLLYLWIVNKLKSNDKNNNNNNNNNDLIESKVNFKSPNWNDKGGLTNKLAISLGLTKEDKKINEIFQIVKETYQLPSFLNVDDLNNEIVDEWSIIAYFSCWFEIFNKGINDNNDIDNERKEEEIKITDKKGEFSEFFGPNILNKASAIAEHDYNMPLKLRIETFLVISSKIIMMKNKFLSKLEKLLLEIVNLLGQFAEFENYDYESFDNDIKISINEKYNLKDINLENCDLLEIENQIFNDNNNLLSLSINKAIENLLFVLNFRKSTNEKIYEQFIELKIDKFQLTDIFHNYKLQEFIEPPEKSINKISKFLDLLKKSELNVYSNANEFIENNLNKLIKSFNENKLNLSKSFKLIENDIFKANQINNSNDKIKEFKIIKNDLSILKEFHLRTIINLNEIEMINSSLGKGFNKQYYKFIINEQRLKFKFFEDCIDKSINFLNAVKIQTNEAFEVLKIANISENFEKSQQLKNINKDEIQLKTHLLVHKLIQKKFQFNKNINPIQVLFDKHDTGSKGYLTKSEFKKAFLVAYPNTANLAGIDEIDTVFETSYETIGKMRRGIEYPQFKAVIELGNKNDKINKINNEEEINEYNNENNNDGNLLKSIDLTSNYFYNSFIELSDKKDILDEEDLKKINLNPILKNKLNLVFPDYKFNEWFEHIDKSSIYHDNEDCEDQDNIGFGNQPKEIALKNVLYNLEKVDLSKI